MASEQELVELSLKAYGKEPLRKIADIICYESGDVLRDTIRMEDYPDCFDLYKRNLRTSLGDVLAMSQLLCSMADLDFQVVYEEGCKRAKERCQEKLNGMDGF